jgi:uncharacterized protein
MSGRIRKAALVLVALFLPAFQRPLTAAFPRPSGYVNDFASVLTEDDRAYLENYLRTVERDTTAEVVVATVTSLDGLSIEEYASRLFADWGIGKKASDNGVLLLVAPAERRVRIEVGYGLEGSLPDGLAGEIIRAAIVPEFQQGNLRRGIGRGLDRIARVVRGDAVATVSVPVPDSRSDIPPLYVAVPFFGIFVVLGGFAGGLGLRTRTIGPLVGGGMFTAIPLFIAAMMSAASLAILVPLELLAMAFGYRKGRSDYWRRTLRGNVPYGSLEPDAWMMGGTSGSPGDRSSDREGSSSSSSSSSDFGGGSSGGGGASGHW